MLDIQPRKKTVLDIPKEIIKDEWNHPTHQGKGVLYKFAVIFCVMPVTFVYTAMEAIRIIRKKK